MRPTDLRGILRYVPQFREKTFVIAADGAVVGDENFGNILRRGRAALAERPPCSCTALCADPGPGRREVSAPSDSEGSGVTDAATLQLAPPPPTG